MAVEAEELALPGRSHMWKHEAMVEWINETEGINLDDYSAAEIISWAFAKRAAWRKSEVSGSPYRQLLLDHAAELEAEREELKAQRAAEREAAKAEREAEKAAKAAQAAKAAPAAKATKAAKPAAAKATRATKAAKTAPATKAAAPAKATRATRATKKAAASDSPFD
jgi:hypothetical protein